MFLVQIIFQHVINASNRIYPINIIILATQYLEAKTTFKILYICYSNENIHLNTGTVRRINRLTMVST